MGIFGGFKVEKCQIQCQLGLGRIKLQRNKKQIQLRQSRRDVSELLKTGKQEYARIRVEGVIREQLMLQAFDILELYLELIGIRAQLVSKTKEVPRDMIEAVASICYSAERIGDMPEIQQLRLMFEAKYGKEWVGQALSDASCHNWQVNQQLIKCLLLEAPAPDVKLAMLSEIAQEYGVEWDANLAAREMLPPPSMQAPEGNAPPGPSVVAPARVGIAPSPLQCAQQAARPQQQQQQQVGGPWPPSYTQPPPRLDPQRPGPLEGMQYTDASQAAAAAAHAAMQAKVAADYAASFAMFQAGMPQQSGPASSSSLQPPSPTHPCHNDFVHASTAPAGPGQHQLFVQRSEQDLQAAYDEAQGPPPKIHQSPSAPPQPLGDGQAPYRPPPFVPATFAPPLDGSAAGGSSLSQGPDQRLPAPPSAQVQMRPPPAPEDEVEALTKRLDALRRR